jgi:hypothetical protein
MQPWNRKDIVPYRSRRKHKTDTPKEKIVLDRIWKKRPDGFAIKMPTKTKTGERVILEFKHMSCVTTNMSDGREM